jgi:hypothetical protein
MYFADAELEKLAAMNAMVSAGVPVAIDELLEPSAFGDHPGLVRVRADLLRKALPMLAGVREPLKVGERPSEYLERLRVDAQKREDWNLYLRTITLQRSFEPTKHRNAPPPDAMTQFFIGMNQERAGQLDSRLFLTTTP